MKSKIALIIEREYLTRVKKKTFIIMSIVGPLLMAAIMVIPVVLALTTKEEKNIMVVDESLIFDQALKNTENLKFEFTPVPLASAKEVFKDGHYDCLLYIHKDILTTTNGVQLYFKKQPGMSTVRYMEKAMEREVEQSKLEASGIDKVAIESAKTSISLNTIKLDESGNEEKGSSELATIVGYIAGIMIYLFIFLYGVQVMRGVIEEKSNRIVEVIISSVKPFELMMGKIIGVALVGLTQFLIWIVLTAGIYSIGSVVIAEQFGKQGPPGQSIEKVMSDRMQTAPQSEDSFSQDDMKELQEVIGSINFPLILSAFLFYFLGGYLLYSAMFAAIGSAVDNETDSQQFMMPVTIPLVLSFVMSQVILNNPEGSIAFWFSIFPLTSPVIMMVRLPFGVPIWEMALSMSLLVLGFIFMVWLAGKIYRTGVMMYGKKVTYKELFKWLRYS
jgi:ABC-2 type transport system permease protein